MSSFERLSNAAKAKALANTDRLRNVAVIAHVDHGKTTLTDSLVASNDLISEKMAGTLRFLDSREDEQVRGITMQSSAISLLHYDEKEVKRWKEEGGNGTEPPAPYVINLIDSPGHIDFSCDVTTAMRLCDGALLLVDCVEGVCVQTHTVLRQAWSENVKTCLVLNKVDRLITELRLTPHEAHQHLRQVVERVNAFVGQMMTNAQMDASSLDGGGRGVGASTTTTTTTTTTGCNNNNNDNNNDDSSGSKSKSKSKRKTESNDNGDGEGGSVGSQGDASTHELDIDEEKESSIMFSPERGNVVFASSRDKWAFSVPQSAQLLSRKLGIRARALRGYLWGHYTMDVRAKKYVEMWWQGKCTRASHRNSTQD